MSTQLPEPIFIMCGRCQEEFEVEEDDVYIVERNGQDEHYVDCPKCGMRNPL